MDSYKKDLFAAIPGNQQEIIKLSPSSLNLFVDCPRCFWLQVNKGLKRPGVPVATITSGLDRVIKEYLEQYRKNHTLPSFLEGKIKGKLMVNFPKRGWIDYMDKSISARLGGFLDECVEFVDGHYAPLDHKTRGSAPDGVHKAYQLQMDCYTFLLEENKLPTHKLAYLAYYIPKKVSGGTDFEFEVLIKEVACDPARAKDIFQQAVSCIRGPVPGIEESCGFCSWLSTKDIK